MSRCAIVVALLAVATSSIATAGVFRTDFNFDDVCNDATVVNTLRFQDGGSSQYEHDAAAYNWCFTGGKLVLNSTKTIAGFEDMSFIVLYPYGFFINQATECQITMAQETVEDVRDGVLPEGLMSGLFLYKGDFSVMLAFGIIRRPAAAAVPNDRISRDGAHQASVPREEGNFIVFGSTGGYEAGTLFGALPIPEALTGDVVLKAETSDGSTYRFYADDVLVAEVPLNTGVQANSFGFVAQNYTDTASFIPQFAGITFTGLRMEGGLVPDLGIGLVDQAGGDVEIVSVPEEGWIDVGGRVTLSIANLPTGASNFAWRKDGVYLTDDDRITGSDTSTLEIYPTVADDAGAYSCVFDDGSKAVVEVGPYILSFVDLPVAGLAGLLALAGLVGAGAFVSLRRRK